MVERLTRNQTAELASTLIINTQQTQHWLCANVCVNPQTAFPAAVLGITLCTPVMAKSHKPVTCAAADALLSPGPLHVRVRFADVTPEIQDATLVALKYWSGILDMDYRVDDDIRTCNLQVVMYNNCQYPQIMAVSTQPGVSRYFDAMIRVNPYSAIHAHGRMLVQMISHECGHTFGLGHSTDTQSIMYPILPQAGDTLDAADIAALAARHTMRQPLTASK